MAPAPQLKHFGHHYAMLIGDPNPFLIDNDLYRKLAAEVLEP